MHLLIQHLRDLSLQAHDKLTHTTIMSERCLLHGRINQLSEILILIQDRPDPVEVLQKLLDRAKLVPCKNGGEDATEAEVQEGKAMNAGKWRIESSLDGIVAEARRTVDQWTA